MKKYIFILVMCLASTLCRGVEIKETSTIFPEYQGIVNSNISASDLYTKAKLWIAENFRSANDVIQLDSPETGTIICKGIYVYDQGKLSEMRVHMTLKVEAKDNRFRYTVTVSDMRAGTRDVSGYSMYAKSPEGKYATKFSDEFRTQIKSWMVGIMNAGVNNTSDDEW